MTTNDFITYFRKNYKRRTSSFLSGIMIMAADAAMLFMCIGLSFFIANIIDSEAVNFKSFVNYSYYFPLILIVYYAAGLYPGIMVSPSDEVRKLSICSAFCFIGIILSIIVQNGDGFFSAAVAERILKDTSKKAAIFSFCLAIPFTTIFLPGFREVARHIYGHFKWWGVPAVIYTTGNSADTVIQRLLKRKALGYKPAIIIDSTATDCSMKDGIPVFPDSKEILEIIRHLHIKVAILCDYEGNIKPVASYYRYTITCSKNQDSLTTSLHLRDMGGILAFSATHELTKKYNLLIKRLIDILLIVIFLPVLIPVMLVLALGVKLTSPGPVFYGHKRVGKRGKEIKCWKFRSMYKNSQEMLEEILRTNPEMKEEWERERKFVNDPRVTKFGSFLRKTSLDELPQLFNILSGQMSFVGPRPVTRDEIEKYGDSAEYVLSVTPGLSGMWQISGRSDTGYEERINLDSFYIQNWSLWLDIWILIKTVWVVINGKGAY